MTKDTEKKVVHAVKVERTSPKPQKKGIEKDEVSATSQTTPKKLQRKKTYQKKIKKRVVKPAFPKPATSLATNIMPPPSKKICSRMSNNPPSTSLSSCSKISVVYENVAKKSQSWP